MKRAKHRRRSRRPPAWDLLACALRMLILMLAVQLSGAAAVVVEAGLGALDRAECCDDCPIEKSGKECPPGCPSCHCAHGQVASLPASSPVLEMLLSSEDAATAEPLEASAPHAPFLPSLYRPPRVVRS
jgi:hypothetical protein